MGLAIIPRGNREKRYNRIYEKERKSGTSHEDAIKKLKTRNALTNGSLATAGTIWGAKCINKGKILGTVINAIGVADDINAYQSGKTMINKIDKKNKDKKFSSIMDLINYTKEFGFAQEYHNRIEADRAAKHISKAEVKRDNALFKAEGHEVNGLKGAAMRSYRKADSQQRKIDHLKDRHAEYLNRPKVEDSDE